MATRSLNIAVLVRSDQVPDWQYQLLQRTLSLWQIHLKMIILAKDVKEKQAPVPIDLALSLLKRVDRLGYRSSCDPLKTRSLKKLCNANVFHDLDETALQSIYREQPIDILLNLAECRWLPKYLFNNTRFGVWRIFAGCPGSVCNQWVGVEAHVSGEGHLYAGVLRQTSSSLQDEVCIFLTSNCTSPVFLHRSVEPFYWKMSGTLPRLIQQLRGSSGPEKMLQVKQQRYNKRVKELALDDTGSTEKNWQVLGRFLCTLILGKWSALLSKLLIKEQWTLLYGESSKLENLKRLMPPADGFWADPQLIHYGQRCFVFFEEWVDQQNKGRIVYIEWYGGDDFSPVQPVLEEDFHLSYPHIFQFQGVYYMIPESADNRTISLYRCTRFPADWEFVHNLMEGIEAYDATLQEHQGRWWLFVNIRDHECCSSDDLLYLFSADSPLSQSWQSHPANPIVSEVDRARPAGKIISIGDKLYRPSQNCAGSYGRGLNLNQIVKWNREEYQECTLRQYVPDHKSKLYGLHTFSMLGNRILSDGIVKKLHWKWKR